MKGVLGSLRTKLVGSGVVSLDVLLAGFPLACATVAGAAFICGGSVSPAMMPSVFALFLAVAAFVSPKTALAFALSVAAALVLTAFTFTYVQWDAVASHQPMASALLHGWNPVRDWSPDAVEALIPSGGMMALHHAFDPRFTAVVSAMVSSSTGLYTAAAFPAYLFAFVLVRLAYRFCRAEWGCGAAPAAVFATICAAQPQLASQAFQGRVDYLFFAACASSVFAFLLRRREGRLCHAALFWAALAVAAQVKFSGVGFVVAAVAAALAAGRRDKALWALAPVALCVLLVSAFSPYVTSSVHYGSPLYPAHTFSSSVELADMTSDFSANADAASMGYLSRIVYAWFSPDLAVWAKRLAGPAGFAPAMSTASGEDMDGFGPVFAAMMCLSVPLLAFSRSRAAQWTCLFVFAVSNLSPLRYIGYGRYFPLMWLIPAFAAFSFACAPALGADVVRRFARPVLFADAAAVALALAATVAAAFEWQLATEGLRQAALEEFARGGGKTLRPVTTNFHEFGHTVRERLEAAGVKIEEGRNPTLHFTSSPMFLPAVGREACEKACDRWLDRKPFPEFGLNLLSYGWGFDRFPRPVMRR